MDTQIDLIATVDQIFNWLHYHFPESGHGYWVWNPSRKIPDGINREIMAQELCYLTTREKQGTVL